MAQSEQLAVVSGQWLGADDVELARSTAITDRRTFIENLWETASARRYGEICLDTSEECSCVAQQTLRECRQCGKMCVCVGLIRLNRKLLAQLSENISRLQSETKLF